MSFHRVRQSHDKSVMNLIESRQADDRARYELRLVDSDSHLLPDFANRSRLE